MTIRMYPDWFCMELVSEREKGSHPALSKEEETWIQEYFRRNNQHIVVLLTSSSQRSQVMLAMD
jgi:hypothetical protein